MKFSYLKLSEINEIMEFFKVIKLNFHVINFKQFVLPMSLGKINVGSLIVRNKGKLQGILGYVDIPGNINGMVRNIRCPLNFFLHPDLRNKNIGKKMMLTLMNENPYGMIIGGNQNSIPVLIKTGWQLLGHMNDYQLITNVQRNKIIRIPQTFKIVDNGRVLTAKSEDTVNINWVLENNIDYGCFHNAEYLEFAFGRYLKPFNKLYSIRANEKYVGHIVLTARKEDNSIVINMTDVNSKEGFEREVLKVGISLAMIAGNRINIHLMAHRFTNALNKLAYMYKMSSGLPIFIYSADYITNLTTNIGQWHITYADHDRYRYWLNSISMNNFKIKY